MHELAHPAILDIEAAVPLAIIDPVQSQAAVVHGDDLGDLEVLLAMGAMWHRSGYCDAGRRFQHPQRPNDAMPDRYWNLS